jgi:hypothetical protein
MERFARAANTALHTAAELAEIGPYFVLMSNEAFRLYSDAVRDQSKIPMDRVRVAKAAFWKDFIPTVRKYAEKNDCETVKLILKGYEEYKNNEPELFVVSRQHPNIFKHLMAEKALLKCFPGET